MEITLKLSLFLGNLHLRAKMYPSDSKLSYRNTNTHTHTLTLNKTTKYSLYCIMVVFGFPLDALLLPRRLQTRSTTADGQTESNAGNPSSTIAPTAAATTTSNS